MSEVPLYASAAPMRRCTISDVGNEEGKPTGFSFFKRESEDDKRVKKHEKLTHESESRKWGYFTSQFPKFVVSLSLRLKYLLN